MPILTNDPLTQIAFSMYEGKGVFALLLGSGLSRAAEIPTGWEITLDLIRRVALAEGIEDQTDWASWYHDKTGEDPNYSTLLEELASSPTERRSLLHSYIEPSLEDRDEDRKVPTAAHYAIADLVRGGYIKVIVTTNFDRLIENALRERGVEPTVVASADALAGAEPISHSDCYILKLHGDYKDARILNTEAELSGYPEAFDRLLDRILDEYGMVVSGWSGEWDHALRSAILRTPNRRYPTFWTARRDVSPSAKELVDHRDARVVPISNAETFFKDLHQRVLTLAQTHRQNPLSTDLLVGSTKRMLAKPEYRIQLDELFADEVDRILALVETDDMDPSRRWDQADFRFRVTKYEGATEALARMTGVLGRWGDGTGVQIALDIVRSLYAQAEEVRGGTSVYLNLRSYPAVLVFTAYCLGLTRAERWSDLHRFLDASLAQKNNEALRTVEALFLWAWKGTENEVWKQLEGLEKRKTPLSDHLLSVFSEWSESFSRPAPNFGLSFERFEVLASLAHFEQNEASSVEAGLEQNPQQGWAWMPVGRSAWHSSNADLLLRELQAEATRAALTQAGFAKGDPKFIDLFIRNFQSATARMHW